MTDDFDDPPPPPIESLEERQRRDKKVDAWRHDLGIKSAQLDEALAELRNPTPSTDHAKAMGRVEHHAKRLKSLTEAILEG